MIQANVCRCLFLLTFLQSASYIQLTSHGHNNAYIHDESNIQYLLDTIPAAIRTEHNESEDGITNPSIMDNTQSIYSSITFEPTILDFKERQLGIPYQETVTLFNKHSNRTIQLSSISGNTPDFHSSFFQEKVIMPLGNTTFKVVFLGRDESEIDSCLYIQTSEGTIKYRVKGKSVSSLYRLRPLVEAKIPINASFTPIIYMYNPRPEPMQVMEVYSSGGEFQLELPSGEAEGSRETWEIAPYQTKPVIRLHFDTFVEKNHTAYIRFKVNNSAEILVVAVEVQVGGNAGLHWAGNTEVVNFGMGGSSQSPTHYPITLKNSAKKPIKVVNIISTPVSKALKINFKPTTIPADTDTPVAVGSLVYDWKTGLDLQEFKGKLTIKGVGSSGSTQKISIPWVAQVFQGGLEVLNTSAAHYCFPHFHQPRNFSAINRFKLPLAISNVSIRSEAASYFSIINFVPKILKPGQKDEIFSLSMTRSKKNEHFKLESSILIHSNVSTIKVPLLSYNGKLKKIIPGERECDKGTMNFGMVGSGTKNEAVFALENQNPVNVELHGWGVNMPGAVLELTGCQNGPKELFDKGYRNVTACSITGNQSIKPGYLAIFKIKVKTPAVEDDTIVGDVFVKTTYERLTVPVYMRVAYGRISMKKLIFTDCFPGSVCTQEVKVHSTFAKPMEVTFISSVHKDNRVKYIPLKETDPVISKGNNTVGSIVVNPSVDCEPECYLGLSLNSSVGTQWLNTIPLPSHTRDFDLNQINARYSRYLNSTGGGSWDNITMLLDTTEVRGYKFHVNIKPSWPSLLASGGIAKNKSLLLFPLTQVGNTTYKKIRLHNPSSSPLYIHLTMDWSYPQGMRLYESLPDMFKVECSECSSTVPGEFKLESVEIDDTQQFKRDYGIVPASNSVLLILQPSESRLVRFSYTPSSPASSSGLVYIRNNMTILEVLRLSGRGAHAQFKFGNRKPGSTTPLLFELSEKHLKDCEFDNHRNRKNGQAPNFTVKRTFTARNTGELPINVYGFYISGLMCEGYGFKVLNCGAFTLSPNATKKIDIAFTPDFTLSRIERELVITTSLENDITTLENHEHRAGGIVRLTLLTTIPVHMLQSCEQMLPRPPWESSLQWTAISLLFVLLVCVLAVSFLEADRILRSTLADLSRGSPVMAPLDFRLLSQQSSSNCSVPLSVVRDKSLTHEEKSQNKITAVKKEDSGVLVTSEWLSQSTKKYSGNRTKASVDFPTEEERKSKADQEIKETTTLKRCNVNSCTPVENANSTTVKKKNGKRHIATTAESENSSHVESNRPIANGNVSSKTSPVINRKNKSSCAEICSSKDEYKLAVDSAEVLQQQATETQSTLKDHSNKTNNKRKQYVSVMSSYTNEAQVNNASYKKYDNNASQKITQYSEEETSSTTTESSAHEDNAATKKYKDDCDHGKQKGDKSQRKSSSKKNKPTSASPINSSDYKDNYEGDCDDDEYDKEKPGNPNRWKTNITRSSTRHHYYQLGTNCVPETNNKLSHKVKNAPRKDKNSQKRRSSDKNRLKHQQPQQPATTNGITSQKDETKSQVPPPIISSSIVPPPSCWGENRAKFSDVVARNQDSMLTSHGACNKSNRMLNQMLPTTSYNNEEKKSVEMTKQEAVQNTNQAEYKYDIKLSHPNCNQSMEKELNSPFSRDILTKPANDLHVNSFFINSFTETPYEPELVPYDDLPETDEPLVELESMVEEQPCCTLWQDSSTPLSNAPGEGVSTFQLEPPKPTETIRNLPDPIKDNWVTVETNWEPLYTRGAVGEERSGVWGVNTGGVWAAAPWGSPTSPSSTVRSPTSLLEAEVVNQERSGFDPFRSLSTIWTPSSSESWKKKQDE